MDSRKKRFVFVINSLTGGGAERAMANLLHFSQDAFSGDDIHLVLLDREPERHEIAPWVQRTTLDSRHGFIRSTIQLYAALARLRPDVTISFLTRANCANIVASSLLRRPCVISERVHTSSHFGSRWRSLLPRSLVRLFYPRADHVVAVSRNVKHDLADNFGVPIDRISVIGNGISLALIQARAREAPTMDIPDRFVLAAGRLVPAKNFAMLIEAYAQADLDCPLIILGEGPERGRLEAMIEKYDLAGRVLLPGYVANPYPIIRRARMFVSSSNAEGFPNALVEAMALGCPVVATDCEAGPAEILDAPRRATSQTVTAEYGLLVPVNAAQPFAQAMRSMMVDETHGHFAAKAKIRAGNYAPQQVVDSYLAVLATACGPRNSQAFRGQYHPNA